MCIRDRRIIAYYEIPKSTSKKKRREMLEHRIRPTKKPDWDNIGKIVCDSLNLVDVYKRQSEELQKIVDEYREKEIHISDEEAEQKMCIRDR